MTSHVAAELVLCGSNPTSTHPSISFRGIVVVFLGRPRKCDSSGHVTTVTFGDTLAASNSVRVGEGNSERASGKGTACLPAPHRQHTRCFAPWNLFFSRVPRGRAPPSTAYGQENKQQKSHLSCSQRHTAVAHATAAVARYFLHK